MQKTQATHFLFIDADVHFDPESVMRLIDSGHDIAVACYPKKCIMWDRLMRASRRETRATPTSSDRVS
jgi:hypothetical protein